MSAASGADDRQSATFRRVASGDKVENDDQVEFYTLADQLPLPKAGFYPSEWTGVKKIRDVRIPLLNNPSAATLPSRVDTLGITKYNFMAALSAIPVGNCVVGFKYALKYCGARQLIILPIVYSRTMARALILARLFFSILFLLVLVKFVSEYFKVAPPINNCILVASSTTVYTCTQQAVGSVGVIWGIGVSITIFVMFHLREVMPQPQGMYAFCRSMGPPPVEELMMSYCWASWAPETRTLAKALWNNGVGVWIDVLKFVSGDLIRPVTRSMARQAHKVIVFLSSDYVKSPNCCVEFFEIVACNPGKMVVCLLPGNDGQYVSKETVEWLQKKQGEGGAVDWCLRVRNLRREKGALDGDLTKLKADLPVLESLLEKLQKESYALTEEDLYYCNSQLASWSNQLAKDFKKRPKQFDENRAIVGLLAQKSGTELPQKKVSEQKAAASEEQKGGKDDGEEEAPGDGSAGRRRMQSPLEEELDKGSVPVEELNEFYYTDDDHVTTPLIVKDLDELLPVVNDVVNSKDISIYRWWQRQDILATGVPTLVHPSRTCLVPTWKLLTTTFTLPEDSIVLGSGYFAGNCLSTGLSFSPPYLFYLQCFGIFANIMDLYVRFNDGEKRETYEYIWLFIVAAWCFTPMVGYKVLMETRRGDKMSGCIRPLLASSAIDPGVKVRLEGDSSHPIFINLYTFLENIGHCSRANESKESRERRQNSELALLAEKESRAQMNSHLLSCMDTCLGTDDEQDPFVTNERLAQATVYIMTCDEHLEQFLPLDPVTKTRSKSEVGVYVWAGERLPFHLPYVSEVLLIVVSPNGSDTSIATSIFNSIGVIVSNILHKGITATTRPTSVPSANAK